MLKIKRAF